MELVRLSNEVDLDTDIRICTSLLHGNPNLLVAFFMGRSKARRCALINHKTISVKIPNEVKDFLVNTL
jgi:hypothetical protein